MQKYPLVDVHTHLYDDKFKDDFPDIIKSAIDANIKQILVVSEDANSAHQTLQLYKNYPSLRPCLGLHPCSISNKDQISEMCSLIEEHQRDLVAIGEVGLDFSPFFVQKTETMTSDERKELQRHSFKTFIQLSQKLNLPLNVHSRSAGRPAIQLLKENNAKRVLLHAFDGSKKVVNQGLQEGFYFSIPPSIVRSKQKQELAKLVPIDRLMLETDSPALGPVKMERNEPKNILHVVKMIAEIKKMSEEEVARITTENAKKLFDLKI